MDPLDVWRSAQLLVKRHGLRAPQECRRRTAGCAAQNDVDGAAIWQAIRRAVGSLLKEGVPGDIPSIGRRSNPDG